MPPGTCVEVGGQVVAVSSLPPCGPWDQIRVVRLGGQVPLPTEPCPRSNPILVSLLGEPLSKRLLEDGESKASFVMWEVWQALWPTFLPVAFSSFGILGFHT